MNWKVLIAIAQIAMKARTRIPLILFIFELLRQFDRSLASAGPKKGARRTGKAGYVYVIRDQTGDRWFKTGYRAKPPWLDSHLRASGEFVLIIPAKDAKGLEKGLRRAYAKGRKKREGFDLNERELRELLITAALVQVVAGDDLGMPEVDQEIVQVAADLLRQFQGRAAKIWMARKRSRLQPDHVDQASKSEPILNDFSAIPEIDWEWESVLDENYRDLPKAKGKAGYVCIIRDNDARRGKIFFDNHPVESIEAAFLEKSLRFPLEIVMILKVDRIKKAAESLLSPSERKEGTEWVELTPEELGEFRQSAKEEYVHGSLYVGPKTHWGLEKLNADNYRDYRKLKKPAGHVCVVQGVHRGKLYKIWETSHPKGLVEDRWQSRELNNLHDMLTVRKPIEFHVIIKCKYADSFREFLQERYHDRRRHSGWFELKRKQLAEIARLGE
ncbi:MAG: hypothetical protein OXN88_15045 [Chloroflexota bacterium]|nr:hypothetical protein [Chloroflexota bacterium]